MRHTEAREDVGAPSVPRALWLGLGGAAASYAALFTFLLLAGCASAPKPEHIAPQDCFIWVIDRDGTRTCLEERPHTPPSLE